MRTNSYEKWKYTHNCQINHNGHSGSIEVIGEAGAIKILRYSKDLKDRDTTSFTRVVASQPYEDELKPIKLECVGHCQKRRGNCLLQKRKDLKGIKLSDGKRISGRGRLTEKVINPLKSYVGMVMRQNPNYIIEIGNTIITTLYHCTNFQYKESRHLVCSKGKIAGPSGSQI